MLFQEAAAKAQTCLVGLYLNDRGVSEDQWDVASGVLITIGARHFVLTAGHNLSGLAPQDVFLMFPRTKVILPWKGGRAVAKLYRKTDPDVGIVELDSSESVYWRHMTPLSPSSVGDVKNLDPTTTLLLMGFPSEKTSTQKLDPNEDPKTPHLFMSAAIAIRASLAANVRSPYEPATGRGFHVVYHGDGFFNPETGESVALPSPIGLSGGPVLALSEKNVVLLGLARSKHGESQQYEWCEPAVEAIQLLLDHEDNQVRTSASEIIERNSRGSA